MRYWLNESKTKRGEWHTLTWELLPDGANLENLRVENYSDKFVFICQRVSFYSYITQSFFRYDMGLFYILILLSMLEVLENKV